MGYLLINSTGVDTVIFDFDGTLAKLNIDFDQMRREIGELIARYGIDQRRLRHRYVLEIINETIEILRAESPGATESFSNDAFRIIEDMEVKAAQNGSLFDETRELLQSLKKHSLRTGIITRNCMRAVQTVFPDISLYCPVVVCRDDVKNVKPHPEQINRALLQLGAQADKAIMIGDHPLDIQTGQNAGTLTAGVLTGHFQANDFIDAGADLVLSKAADILSQRNC